MRIHRIDLPRRGPASRATGAGFTLVELMVVIVILGLVAGVVTVSWQSLMPNQYLNSDVRVLSSRIYSARSDAVARNATFWIWYDIDANSYAIETPFAAGGGFAYTPEQRIWISETNLHDGVELSSITINGETFESGQVPISFDPLGASVDHQIVLYQSAFERWFTIEVVGLTGLIKFHDGYFIREPAEDSDFS